MSDKKPLLVHVVAVPSTLRVFLGGQIQFMQAKGFEVAAISSDGPDADFVEQRDKIKVYRIPIRREISPLSDIVTLWRLRRQLRKLRPAIVHSQITKGGMLGMVAAKLAGVPVRIFKIQGIKAEGETGWRKWVVDKCDTLACACADRIFSVSKSAMEAAIARGYTRPDKITVLGAGSCNGVDALGRFNPEKYPKTVRTQLRQRYGIEEDALVLCFVGRIVRDKGVGELVTAWQKLKADFPNLYLLMVGDYEDEHVLSETAKEALVTDKRIKITGFVRDTPEHYLAADMVVLPSYREGFPYAPLEAAAMSLATVATRVTGCVDAVVDGQTGVLVPTKDPDALYQAVRKLLLNEELRNELGQAARKRVLEKFLPEPMWEELYQEYSRFLNKRGIIVTGL